MEGVPRSLPAVVKALRIQEKVKGIGFEWSDTEDVWAKVKEEMEEFDEERKQNSDRQEEEFGDLLFSLINYSRFVDINPELALEKTNKKFISRFQKMEELAEQEKVVLHELPLEEMDKYWEKAKKLLKQAAN